MKTLDHGTKRRKTMLTTSKIALSLALVLATASAVLAAPKQAVRHQTAIERQVPAGSHLSLNSVGSTGLVRSTGPANQSSDISPLEYEGLAHLIEAIDEIGSGK
jgi:hypothetical protein